MTDSTYMKIAEDASKNTIDKQHPVGACVVRDGFILGAGANVLLRNFKGEFPKDGNRDKPLKMRKYSYMCHAEMSAIVNADQNVSGATIYTTLFPCNECAKLIISLGIKEVVYKEDYDFEEIVETTKILFDGCGIKYRKYMED